jgi:membrane-bound ClpP family serine protease
LHRDESAGQGTEEKPAKKRRQNLAAFVAFSVVEEAVIGATALVAIVLLVPQLILPAGICVVIGLAAFTIAKIYFFASSAAIPLDQGIVGQVVRATQDFRATSGGLWTGRIQAGGESWTAIADETISKDSFVQIVDIQGLRLRVVRVPDRGEHPSVAQQ